MAFLRLGILKMHAKYVVDIRIFFVCLLIIAFASGASDITFRDAHQERFARSLKDFEVTHPVRVSHDGQYLSHNTHFSVDGEASRRRRRSVNVESMTLNYELTVAGKQRRIVVEPNDGLFAPSILIERRRRRFGNVSDSTFSHLQSHCHFRGVIKDEPKSSVALATCDGLHGFVRMADGHYFVEPIKGYNTSEGPVPHLVYHKSSLPDEFHQIHHSSSDHNHVHRDGGICGVSDSTSDDNKRPHDEASKHRGHKRRRKRSYSLERNVETLVVADGKMTEFYKNENIETYILTIMNMVATIYHDSSIGNAINIVLVRLLLVEEGSEPELKITHHAENSLENFCRWQMQLNPKSDSHPNHHDVAVLLTRQNICSRMNEPCSTLGLSQVSGMCQSHRSCNINEDTGLALAFTVAHELGHNFGMQHDGPQNGCEAKPGEFLHVMSPQLTAEASPLIWSNCSRDTITKFLDRDWGFCLDDEPSEHSFKFPVLPPGVMYDADHQCRLQYGPEASLCHGIDNICTTMWCRVNNRCMTRMEAAAEGTICGENMWCFAGRPVVIGERPLSINGEWSQWAPWTECSTTCGPGVVLSERHCNNPPPSNGGKYCLGERKRYRVCNQDKPCAEASQTLRQAQCAAFNKIPYKGTYYEWEPTVTPSTPCQLHCKPVKHHFSVMLKDTVADGTPCKDGTRNMCLSGRCRNIACDWGIDSDAKEDHCGICLGDGTTCKMVKQEFTEQKGTGYVEAMVIPEGARNIRIEETAEANNYLAVHDGRGRYLLNGNWFIQWSGQYEAAGTVLNYKRDGNKESLNAVGPLREPLHVMLLFQSQNPGVVFEYTISSGNKTDKRQPEFLWKYLDWTHCTVSCGGGVQYSPVVCVEREAGLVDDIHCNKSAKPDDMQRSCNEYTCPARWWAGPWQHCSVTCGNNGVNRRTVICVRSLGPDEQIALQDWECGNLEKPIDMRPCRHKELCPEDIYWITGNWSKTCLGDPCDIQTREVTCSDPAGSCPLDTRPAFERKCTNTTCGTWEAGPWTECSKSCDGGVQYRSVRCAGGDGCRIIDEPISERDCSLMPCDWLGSNEIGETSIHEKMEDQADENSINNFGHLKDVRKKNILKGNKEKDAQSEKGESYQWIPLFWSECSRVCGGGKRQRKLMCVEKNMMNEVDSDKCIQVVKPAEQEGCNEWPCSDWTTGSWSECSTTCGKGVQYRDVMCRGTCDPEKQPSPEQSCDKPCPTWLTGTWSACSVTCGDGHQMRRVWCSTGKDDSCLTAAKPTDNQPCSVGLCPQMASFGSECAKDIFSVNVCQALVAKGQCSKEFVRNRCCKSCNSSGR